MKTATLSLSTEHTSGWYVATPYAFQQRDEMGKRMLVGVIIAIALYVLVLGAYFISTHHSEPLPIAPSRKSIVINPIEIVPPSPPDVRQASKPIETVSTRDVAAGILSDLASDKALTKQAVRDAVQMATALAIESGLSQALTAIDKAFGDGLPTPTAGSKNTGMLDGLEGKMGGLVGLNASLAKSEFGNDLRTLIERVAENGGLGDAQKANLGGNQSRATGLGRQGIKVAVRKQNLITKENLRPADDIAHVLERYQPALQDLYTQFSVIGNAKATIQFVIAPDGIVTDAHAVSKSFNNPSFERGMLTTIRRMRFSTIQAKANQTVTVPFNFSDERN